MTWTTDVPKEPGFYWMRSSKITAEVCCVFFSPFHDGLHVMRVYNDESEPLEGFVSCRRDAQWAGPLPDPEDA